MAKRYILKTLDSGAGALHPKGNRAFERNLLNLSALGLKWDSNLIKHIRTDMDIDSDPNSLGYINSAMSANQDAFTKAHSSIAGQNKYIAYYDQTYQMRRDFLRKFALQDEVEFVLETIVDEVIVNDEMHYFAYPNVDRLASILKPENGKKIVDEINSAYRRIYHIFHFNESNDAWQYVYKFLVDGFLAFEIIYSTDNSGKNARHIIGFKELDPVTLQPEIRLDSEGHEYKVWVINKGDAEKERVLLDTNVIYISWSKSSFVSHVSYSERLIRSFNMLRTLENSRLIWNVQNAQKRMKIVVPIGTESDQIAKTRLRQLEALYKEDIYISDYGTVVSEANGSTSTASGVHVNANPNFSYAKTFVFPSREGVSTEISEIGIEGYNLGDTEQMKWFWNRFVIASRVPLSRFASFFGNPESSAIPDNSTMTRDEYRFSLFIDRIRGIISELMIKPMWIEFCLRNPEFKGNDVIKNAIGLDYYESNIFRLAKENANFSVGTTIIQSLSGLMGVDGKPVFSMKFLTKKYLSLSDDDWKLNERLKEEEEKEMLRKGTDGSEIGFGGPGPGAGGGGGLGDFGGGTSLADIGGGMEGGTEPMPEPEVAPAPETSSPEA